MKIMLALIAGTAGVLLAAFLLLRLAGFGIGARKNNKGQRRGEGGGEG